MNYNRPVSYTHLRAHETPEHLKYVYLGEQETFPVVIASHLNERQEENLKTILRKHRETMVGL